MTWHFRRQQLFWLRNKWSNHAKATILQTIFVISTHNKEKVHSNFAGSAGTRQGKAFNSHKNGCTIRFFLNIFSTAPSMDDMSNPCCVSQRNQKIGMFLVSAQMPVSTKFITDLLQLDWQDAVRILKDGHHRTFTDDCRNHYAPLVPLKMHTCMFVTYEQSWVVVVAGWLEYKKFFIYLQNRIKHSRDTQNILAWALFLKHSVAATQPVSWLV